jgi:hypothetical protein
VLTSCTDFTLYMVTIIEIYSVKPVSTWASAMTSQSPAILIAIARLLQTCRRRRASALGWAGRAPPGVSRSVSGVGDAGDAGVG